MDLAGKMDLLRFLGARHVEVGGEMGVFIPYKPNPSIFTSANAAYASVIVRSKRNQDYGQTHFLTLAPTEHNAKVLKTSEIRSVCPILGGLTPLAASATSNKLKTVGNKTGGIYQSPKPPKPTKREPNPILDKGEDIVKKGVKPWDFSIPDDSEDIPL